jgi:hypothetical protein
LVVFQNCEIIGAGGLHLTCPRKAHFKLDNCLYRSDNAAALMPFEPGAAQGVVMEIERSTFVCRTFCYLPLRTRPSTPAEQAPAPIPMRVSVERSIFDVVETVGFYNSPLIPEKETPQDVAEAEAAVRQVLDWRGQRNQFSPGSTRVNWFHAGKGTPLGPQGLKQWQSYWPAGETNPQEDAAQFVGGNLASRPAAAFDDLTPQDFRLREGSAGYRAGPDGKDLGADVDLVGPGAAYERWKQTPEYQQWLKDTGQPAERAAAKPETGAFVVLGGAGVAERKFDTLAQAAQGASDGDTIEIHGNGPFITNAISIRDRALVIRAGAGFRPVLKADPNESAKYLIQSNAPLVLEGLDLQWLEATPAPPESPLTKLIDCWNPKAQLHAANCRFLMNRRDGANQPMTCIGCWSVPVCHLRNCQLLVAGHGRAAGVGLVCANAKNSQVIVDNCLTHGPWLKANLTHAMPNKLILKRNTILGVIAVQFALMNKIDLPAAETASPPIDVEMSANLLTSPVIWFNQSREFVEKESALTASEAEHFLKQAVAWRGNRNLFLRSDDPLLMLAVNNEQLPSTLPVRTLDDWKRFWGIEELDSQAGQARFHGGDLVARAASSPELLNPDDYRLRSDSPGYRAVPDGKDLGADVDLVGPGPAYERWKKTPEYQEWLKDSGQLEKRAVAKAEAGAFVLLGGAGVAERKFDTLAEAVQAASDGDKIEIRGDGPFVTPPIKITNAVSIRAAVGFRPVIQRDATEPSNYLIEAGAPLVLEGLELRWLHAGELRTNWRQLLIAAKALHAANCKFVTRRVNAQVAAMAGPYPVELRNCEFLAPPFFHDAPLPTKSVFLQAQRKVLLDNCMLAGGLLFSRRWGHQNGAELRLMHNTVRTPLEAVQCNVLPSGGGEEDFGGEDWTIKALQVEASGNLIASDGICVFAQQGLKAPLPPGEAENLLARMIGWRGKRNAYLGGSGLLTLKLASPEMRLPPPLIPGGLAGWKQLWGTAEEGSIEGSARFVGGDLLAKADSALLSLSPDDFRLRADSPGYRASQDGKDLGADVDLVGPGPAYERWKKTPEYQQWLKDAGQAPRAEAAKAEPGAFLVLDGKGVAVRTHDTLAKAVQNASDGDTIEIRGNGPFVSQPINIQRTALTIRAGEGFRPIIKLSAEAVQRDVPLLGTTVALVLEGLELHRGAPEDPAYGAYAMIKTYQAPLHAGNCRFRAAIWAYGPPFCVFRNCEFLAAAGVGVTSRSAARIVFENCLRYRNTFPLSLVYDDLALRDVSIEIKRSTFLGDYALHTLGLRSPLPGPLDDPQASKAFRFDVSESIFDAPSVLGFAQSPESPEKSAALPPADAEATLLRLLQWRGERNLFASGSSSVIWISSGTQQPPHGPKNLEEWKRFWATTEADSLERTVRFQGGNLLSRGEADLDQLTPNDFRLRLDSPGYRAGNDGTDLGADVDLVGPGAPYERWKSTPAYQQWLTDTGQEK